MKLIGVLIFLLVAVLYGSLTHAPPLRWDDETNIFSNPFFLAQDWTEFWKRPYFGLYIPITNSIWFGVYKLGQGAVWPFRVLNLSLHLLNTLIIFYFYRYLTKIYDLKNNAALLLGLSIFALHPLQVQSIAWISAGRDLLAATFGLLSIYLYFKNSGKLKFMGATVAYGLALLSKPNLVILPMVIIVLTHLLTPQSLKKSLLKMSIWLSGAFVVIFLTLDAQDQNLIEVIWWQRPLIALDTYSFYLQKFIYPNLLSPNYGRTPQYLFEHPETLIASIGFFSIFLAILLYSIVKKKCYHMAVLWIILLIPSSGIITFGFQRLSTVADHYNYLPIAALGAILLLLLGKVHFNKILMFITPTAASLILFYLSLGQMQIWKGNFSFFERMAQTAPQSYATAVGMTGVMCVDLKRYNEGIEWTKQALKERPNDITALSNWAFCTLNAGDNTRTAELGSIINKLDRDYLRRNSQTPYTRFLSSIAAAMFNLGNYKEGFPLVCEAYSINPLEPLHQENLRKAREIMKKQNMNYECVITGI